VAGAAGIGAGAIKAGLEKVKPLFGRSQVMRGEITLLVDCYNSNPESLDAVLRFVGRVPWKGRKVAVLGSMLELGAGSEAAHAQAGRLACEAGVDRIYLFGEEIRAGREACRALCPQRLALWTADIGRLSEALGSELEVGDLVLIKGSRGMAMERLLEPLSRRAA
jgi:UDP-N-acetylmuramoyl-tripeptide--D-alanyl-D-alanine ligase